MSTPLSQDEINEYIRLKGFDPAEADLDMFTGEVKPKQKAQPALSTPEAPAPTKKETLWRSTALSVLPSAASLPVGAAVGMKAAAAAAPLATVPFVGPAIPVVAGLGAGLLAGGLASAGVSQVQQKVLEQSEGGQKFLERAALARETNPITSAVGDVAGSLSVARPSPRMIKDAFYALTTERNAGAGLLNKLANPAVQEIGISGALGGGMSAYEDVQEGKDVNVGKALVNTALQGLVSNVHPFVANKVPGLRGTSYAGLPGAEPAAEGFIPNRVATPVEPSPADVAAIANERAGLEIKLKGVEDSLKSVVDEAKREQIQREAKIALAELELKNRELAAREQALREKVTFEASPENVEWAKQMAIAKGADEFVTEPTGVLDATSGKTYGAMSVSPEGKRSIRASTTAAEESAKGEISTTLPEGLIRDQEGTAIGPRASTLVHENLHNDFLNMIQSDRAAQRKMGTQILDAIDKSPEFVEWKSKQTAENLSRMPDPREEFFAIEASKQFLRDPENTGRTWRGERAALKNLQTGKGGLQDAVQIGLMKFRYDRGLNANLASVAKATGAKASLASDVRSEIERREKNPEMEQMEFRKTAQEGTPLSKYLRDSQELPPNTFLPKKGQMEMRLSQPSPEVKLGPSEALFFTTEDSPLKKKFFEKYPLLKEINPNGWPKKYLSELYGVDRRRINDFEKAREQTTGKPVDWKEVIDSNLYDPNRYPKMERVAGKSQAVRDEEGELVMRDRPTKEVLSEFTPGAQRVIKQGVDRAVEPLPTAKAGVRFAMLRALENPQNSQYGADKDYRQMLLSRVQRNISERGLDVEGKNSPDRNMFMTASREAQRLMRADFMELRRKKEAAKREAGVMEEVAPVTPAKVRDVDVNVEDIKKQLQENYRKFDSDQIDDDTYETTLTSLETKLKDAGLSRDEILDIVSDAETPAEVVAVKPSAAPAKKTNTVAQTRETVKEFLAKGIIDKDEAAQLNRELAGMKDSDTVNLPELIADIRRGGADDVQYQPDEDRYSLPSERDTYSALTLYKLPFKVEKSGIKIPNLAEHIIIAREKLERGFKDADVNAVLTKNLGLTEGLSATEDMPTESFIRRLMLANNYTPVDTKGDVILFDPLKHEDTVGGLVKNEKAEVLSSGYKSLESNSYVRSVVKPVIGESELKSQAIKLPEQVTSYQTGLKESRNADIELNKKPKYKVIGGVIHRLDANGNYTITGSDRRYSLPAPRQTLTDEKDIFVTDVQKQFESGRPYGLQTSKDGKFASSDILAKLRNTPKVEQELLGKDFTDWLTVRSRVSPEEVKEWLEKNGPKVEVHNYGMEGKVSEAKREYDRMTHEWDSSPELQMITELRGEGNSWKEVDEILQKNYGRGEVSTKAYNLLNDENIKSKVDRYNNLKTQVEAERASKDTPRATSAYDTVSAFDTNEPMPEWTTSAREANRGQVEQIKAAAVKSVSGKIYEGNWHMAAREKMEAAGDREASSGYTTTQGRYVNGDEAVNIAENAKQLYQKAQAEKDAGKLKRLDTAHIKKANEEGELAAQPTKNLAPRNVQRVDVVIPRKPIEDKSGLGRATHEPVKWQPDNLHENLPNTLGWAMIQYKTGAKGEKIAVIVEAQSRWGQWMQKQAKDAPYGKGNKHPLLRDYNRLILKSAIDQARKEGATHVMISDAETAMITEGHDNIPSISAAGMSQEVAKQNLEQVAKMHDATIKNIIYEKGKRYGEIVAKAEIAPIQEPGMRLNYDTILPKIAEDLTGTEGTRVSLGEHKNAFDNRRVSGGTELVDRNLPGDAPVKPRDNLIFRNPDGTPKTDVSGLLYDISVPASRRESGEKFTFGGRRFSSPTERETISPRATEEDRMKKGFIEAFAPQFDKVPDKQVSEAMKNMDTQRSMYLGAWHYYPIKKFQSKFKHMPEDRLNVIYDRVLETYRKGKKDLITEGLSSQEIKAANFLNDNVYRAVRGKQKEIGMKVETREGLRREAKLSPWYVPEMLNDKALQAFTKGDQSATAQRYIDMWADHVVTESHGTVTKKEALEEIRNYVAAIGEGGRRGTEFGALRKAAGYGLPKELRERNLLRVTQRYSRRAAQDVARFQHLELPEYVRNKLALPDPDTGVVHTQDSILHIEDVRQAMKFVNNSFEIYHNPRVASFARVVTNGILGPLTGIRDFMSIPVNVLPYVKVGDIGTIFTSLFDVRRDLQKSLQMGARTGRHQLFTVDTIPNLDKTTYAFNVASEVLQKFQGRDAIEQVNRVWTYSIGKNLADRAVLENNKAFLEKFGRLAKDEATGKYNTDIMAKNFVDRVQGTYGGAGLPSSAVDGMAAPWFALARWSLEKSNVIWQDVIQPAYRKNNPQYGPLLRYALGAYLTGEAIDLLVEEINSGKKSNIPTYAELQAADADTESYVAKLVNVMQLGSFAGMAGDVAKMAMDVYRGEQPRGFSVPAATLISEGIGDTAVNFSRAVRDGTDPLDAAGILILELMKNQVQTARLVLNAADNEDVDRKNALRDLRLYKQMRGEILPSDFQRANPAMRPEEREFKRAKTEEEAGASLNSIITNLQEEFKNDPRGLRKALDRLKKNSYQTFPNLELDPAGAGEYYAYLIQSLGPVEAKKRLDDYIKQTSLNKAKTAAIP